MKCKHYKGDGYTYEIDRVWFNFCDDCNDELLKQMIDQKHLERLCSLKSKEEERDENN
ncbi:hypothetical protein LCGC14_0622570 [marine sediment metagenome]|uniref:Uncharacterized protein n=1 Tax=marine sediment metagenome TaxID=412755 RepID=A0A0F9TQR4_9ZZZZ